jgi:ubiquinone/menaquinone biosynthesis C-methylase UbiE
LLDDQWLQSIVDFATRGAKMPTESPIELEQLRSRQEDVLRLSPQTHTEFESAYISTRDKEHRILDDSAVLQLPESDPNYLHYREWQIRKKSAERLLSHLKRLPLSEKNWLLDVGCGNGWFSHLAASTLPCSVLGIDINLVELEQAARVFKRKNLLFAYLDILQTPLKAAQASVIIFNASFQYFPEPGKLLKRCQSLLVEGGEIHIVDSSFYSPQDQPLAKKRSLEYYRQLGAVSMTDYYHHHSAQLLHEFNAEVLYQPDKNGPKKGDADSPFPWVKLSR